MLYLQRWEIEEGRGHTTTVWVTRVPEILLLFCL